MHDVNAEPSRPDVAMTREPPAPKPTTTGALALVIARTLDEAGFSGDQALRSVGIASQLSNDPMSRVPVSTMSALYATCVDLTGDPCFGLAVGRSINLTHMHALGHALATSATLMEFCQRLQRFWTLMSDGSAIELVESGDETESRRTPVFRSLCTSGRCFSGLSGAGHASTLQAIVQPAARRFSPSRAGCRWAALRRVVSGSRRIRPSAAHADVPTIGHGAAAAGRKRRTRTAQ
jgi:hypothetical protein